MEKGLDPELDKFIDQMMDNLEAGFERFMMKAKSAPILKKAGNDVIQAAYAAYAAGYSAGILAKALKENK